MVNWIVIGIIVIAVWLFYKFTPLKYERFWTYFIAILMIFLLFSFFSITKKNGIDVSTGGGFLTGAKFYGGWLLGWGRDAAKVTGQVTKTNWPAGQDDNSTLAIPPADSKKKGW